MSYLADALAPFIESVKDKFVPQAARSDYQAMKQDPIAWAANVGKRTITPEEIGSVIGMAPIAGMAKVFKPQAVTDASSLFQNLVNSGSGLRRSSLLPAGKLASGEIIQGGLGGGHGSLYEALSPQATKGMIEGYVPAAYTNPPVFLTRDQGTIASSSLEAIKMALQGLLKK